MAEVWMDRVKREGGAMIERDLQPLCHARRVYLPSRYPQDDYGVAVGQPLPVARISISRSHGIKKVFQLCIDVRRRIGEMWRKVERWSDYFDSIIVSNKAIIITFGARIARRQLRTNQSASASEEGFNFQRGNGAISDIPVGPRPFLACSLAFAG
jgi:hypothetical protein